MYNSSLIIMEAWEVLEHESSQEYLKNLEKLMFTFICQENNADSVVWGSFTNYVRDRQLYVIGCIVADFENGLFAEQCQWLDEEAYKCCKSKEDE